MSVNNIYTDRLVLVPMTLEMASSALEGTYEAFEKAGLSMVSGWPQQDTIDILPIIKERLESPEEQEGFCSWLFVRKDDMAIVGDGGYKNSPGENGIVEIGYGILEGERRKGYCYEAVNALINWAFLIENIKIVIADCLTDNIGSARVLQKCGMKETGTWDGLIHWRKEIVESEN